ncbi:MAG: ABC transporter ATP-binding protein [Planctomycetota bacterium]|nr:ABC transporter ATP-binding protein [Planctomycetota bacterium]MDA1164515.1 ABC transporter ATP-binding protein [Planctomycetota bacterium]
MSRLRTGRLSVIDIQDVTKTHLKGQTEVHALRGVTCSINCGEFHFILGPSGSGKSSLLYLIGALDEPTSGEIIFEGRKLTSLSNAERDAYRRDDVGFIFQSFNLLNNLDAVDNTLVPYLPQGISSERRGQAVAMLQQVGLGDRLDHRPHQLSGGEQQRIAIARALLKQPKLVLADEPTGELDSETGAEVFSLLRKLCADCKTTVVVVTHDHSFVESTDRILRMKDGRLQQPDSWK